MVESLTRPEPPDLPPGTFAPAPDLAVWARAAYLEEDGPFYTEEHAHLAEARIAWSWTNVPGKSKGKQLAGECMLVQARGSQWAKMRDLWLIRRWWQRMPDYDPEAFEGDEPDFLITLFSPWCAAADDASFAALVDHEIYHASQAKDEYGIARVSRETGRPVWEIKGHDLEQFNSVVRRWGAKASGAEELVEAASKPPEIAAAVLDFGCGNCRRAA